MPDFVSIDTLKQSRSGFNFNSNRLDYIGKFLGVGRKKDTGGFGLWKSVTLDNDRDALAKMVDYCEQDVRLLQRVHAQLIPYTKSKSHWGVAAGGTRLTCPECGREKYKVNQRRISGAGVRVVQLQCQADGCGKFHYIPERTFDNLVKLDKAKKATEHQLKEAKRKR